MTIVDVSASAASRDFAAFRSGWNLLKDVPKVMW